MASRSRESSGGTPAQHDAHSFMQAHITLLYLCAYARTCVCVLVQLSNGGTPTKKASGRSSSSCSMASLASASPATTGAASGASNLSTSAGSGSGPGAGSGAGSRGGAKGGEATTPVFADAGPGLYCCTFTLQVGPSS